MILKIGFLYFACMAWGCLTLLPLVALREIGQGFYRFLGFMCVALQTIAIGLLLMAGSFLEPVYQTAGMILGVSLFFTLCFTVALRIHRQWFLWSSFLVAAVSGIVAIADVSWNGQGKWILFLAHCVLSSWSMGTCILAMLIGHWYLLTPKLSIAPLRRYALGYIGVVILTAVELILNDTIYVGWGKEPLTAAGKLLLSSGPFIWFRVLSGIAVPLGLAYWIWKTVKIRSTQSATGILYAAVVCTMMGEGIGFYLTLLTGVPF